MGLWTAAAVLGFLAESFFIRRVFGGVLVIHSSRLLITILEVIVLFLCLESF